MKTPLPLLRSGVFVVAAMCASAALAASNVGKRFPSEARTIVDKVTGVPLNVLTTHSANDAKIYQTHPQWTADGRWIIFRSNRGAPTTPPAITAPGAAAQPTPPAAPSQAFAVNELTGEIVQLTDGPGNNVGTLNIAQKSMKLYFLRGGRMGAPSTASDLATANVAATVRTDLIELNLEKLFADSAAGKMQDASAYERVCATLPEGMRDSGGFGLDATEKFAYLGVRAGDTGKHLPPGTTLVQTVEGQRMGAGPAGLRSINLETGEIKVIIDTPFLMGHVQANPWVPGEIIYCHETGGDAPQRMWTVKADGTGNRPLYVEQPSDWVTHEAVITKDEVVFNLIGHQARLRKFPSGIAVINLRTDEMKIYGQVEDSPPGGRSRGGYWHSNGSADGRWLAGDTFAGNIWLINRATGAQTLLTAGHRMQPDHAHPTFSPDSTRMLIQSGMLSDGASLDLMVVSIPLHLMK